MQRNIKGLCLILGLLSISVFGMGASASARPLLMVVHSGKFPYHMTGTGGASLLETTGGSKIESPAVHALVLATSATLFTTRIEFLKVVSPSLGNSKCGNEGSAENILVTLTGHLGYADPGNVPGALLLVPGGFEFTCGGLAVKVSGEIIGQITAPALNVSSELLKIVFKQNKGIQEFTTFLLGNETLEKQFETSTLPLLGAEQSGQSGEIDLKALPGQGTFLLVDP